jgi:hypothetical protein
MTSHDDLTAVEVLPIAALRAKYREVVGLDVRTHNRAYLLRRIAYVLQQRAEEVARPEVPSAAPASPSMPPTAAPTPPCDEQDPRMPPPGTTLERQYKDAVVRVKVLADGFEFEGRRYRSLSAIAREVTGTIWNGMLFFNLARRKPWKKPSRGG